MKIEDVSGVELPFGSLKPGDVFKFEGNYFLKIKGLFEVIRLNTFELDSFSGIETEVEFVETKLVIIGVRK
jgi:hypothetical protein